LYFGIATLNSILNNEYCIELILILFSALLYYEQFDPWCCGQDRATRYDLLSLLRLNYFVPDVASILVSWAFFLYFIGFLLQ